VKRDQQVHKVLKDKEEMLDLQEKKVQLVRREFKVLKVNEVHPDIKVHQVNKVKKDLKAPQEL
jgi:hypothetical protein